MFSGLSALESQVHYHLSSFTVLIGGPLPRGHEFELHDVRFHWGRENQRGSEHTVNFKAFPMEVRVTLHCITPAKHKRFYFIAWIPGSSKESFFELSILLLYISTTKLSC